MTVDKWSEWARAATKKGNAPAIWQSHGRSDMLLPYKAATWLFDLLKGAGLDATLETHNGGHDFGDASMLMKLSEFLARLADSAAGAGASVK